MVGALVLYHGMEELDLPTMYGLVDRPYQSRLGLGHLGRAECTASQIYCALCKTYNRNRTSFCPTGRQDCESNAAVGQVL